MRKNTQKGFTLIEILVVIGIIAILAAVVLLAINPARQFRLANDSQRRSNVNAILNAAGQYITDQKGDLPDEIDALVDNAPAVAIRNADPGADLCDQLVPTYIPALPVDPSTGVDPGTDANDDQISEAECDAAYDTGYTVSKDDNDRITIIAPAAQEADSISVTR